MLHQQGASGFLAGVMAVEGPLNEFSGGVWRLLVLVEATSVSGLVNRVEPNRKPAD